MNSRAASSFRRSFVQRLVLASPLLLAEGCARHSSAHWDLTDISGALPDLRFSLASGGNPHLTARDFRGKIVLLYFGYLHCPDVCPMTMARLGGVLRSLGSQASGVRILFVSVDPKRDTPALVQAYAAAFSTEAVGATGTVGEIVTLAKRYRFAFQAEPPDRLGNYVVMHSKAVYVFDQRGRVHLLTSDTDQAKAIEHDLRQLLAAP